MSTTEQQKQDEREKNAFLDGFAAGALRHDRAGNSWAEGGWRGFSAEQGLGPIWTQGYDAGLAQSRTSEEA